MGLAETAGRQRSDDAKGGSHPEPGVLVLRHRGRAICCSCGSEPEGPTRYGAMPGREQAYWLDAYEARVRARGDRSDDSRYARMQAEYAAYRSYRLQEQAWFELAKALDGETQPSVIETADRVVTLEGTLDVQYETWRRLLRDIFAAEQGLET